MTRILFGAAYIVVIAYACWLAWAAAAVPRAQAARKCPCLDTSDGHFKELHIR